MHMYITSELNKALHQEVGGLRGGELVCPTHVADYVNMKIGHIGSPQCTLLVFFFC